MSRLNHIEVFLEVARQQSFAKAAKTIGITGPAASKQVQALEEELGVRLLNRTTRLVTLTEEGAIYYDRARLAMEDLREAAELAQESKISPKGTLRVSAPLSFGQMHLLPLLSGFAKKYPDLTLDVSLDDRMVDVMKDGFDVVIRIGVPQDSTLMSRHLGEAPILLVASPAYLEAHGTPKTPDDLSHHRLIAYSYQGGTSEWRYRDPSGKNGAFRAEGHFRANTSDMMLQAALDSVGIALLPHFCVSIPLQSGQLVHVMPGYETTPLRHITALMPPNRHRSTRVRLFLDWLVEGCKAMPL